MQSYLSLWTRRRVFQWHCTLGMDGVLIRSFETKQLPKYIFNHREIEGNPTANRQRQKVRSQNVHTEVCCDVLYYNARVPR